MNPYEIEAAALRLRDLDREFIENILKGAFDELNEIVEEFRKLKRQIQAAQIDSAQLRISSSASAAVLRQIREGSAFHIDRLFALQHESGERLPLDELSEAEIDDLGSDLFYSWFSHHEYIQALYRLGTLLVTADVPDRVLAYLSEARQCYAFQQYHATLALCRTFIEATARDICEQLGLVGTGPDAAIAADERRFSRLAGAVTEGQLRRRINQLYYGLASPVVHGVRSVSAEDARQAIKDTLALAEDMYDEHGLSTAA